MQKLLLRHLPFVTIGVEVCVLELTLRHWRSLHHDKPEEKYRSNQGQIMRGEALSRQVWEPGAPKAPMTRCGGSNPSWWYPQLRVTNNAPGPTGLTVITERW